jgi:competence protein ComEC
MQWTSAPNIGEAPLPQRARSYWKARFSAAGEALEKLLEAERAQLPPWFVVGFGTGIAAWFALDGPAEWIAVIGIAAAISAIGFAVNRGRTGTAIGWFTLSLALGGALAWARAEWAAAPRLARPRVVTFDSHVEKVENLVARGVIRLTLIPADSSLPPRVRVSIPEEDAPQGILDGATLRLRARLVPPPPMPLPGAYDFARDAWFKGIGAVGKNLGPVQLLAPGGGHFLDRLRAQLGQHIRERLPGPAGGAATALATGDQHAVGKEDADAMRRAGLIYLLVVSGLHVAAVVGAAMFLTIKLLATSERLALRLNLVLVAAGVGALAGTGYTLLTGMQIPTMRSCIGALLVLAGIALGRDAISLRLLAAAALILLAYRPESLVGPSFQLSFAAIAAIIALHSTAWARRHFTRRDEGAIGRFGRILLGMFATSLAVEIALAPLSLYHFHRAGLYGMAASVVALPLTTLVIMPLEGAALFMDLVGLGAPLWYLCGKAIGLLLWISHEVGEASGAVTTLPSMPQWAFAAMVVGGIWFCLWNSRMRLIGVVPFSIGLIGAALAPSPDLLITGDGRHLAVVDHGVPYILRDKAGDYVRSLLAEVSGYDSDPELLDDRSESDCSRDACVALLRHGDAEWRLLATRSAYRIDWADITNACAASDIVVSDRRLPRGCHPRWLRLDAQALGRTGGLAIYLGKKPWVDSVAARVGKHPWAAEIALNTVLSSRRAAPGSARGGGRTAGPRNCGWRGRAGSCFPRGGKS